MLVPRSYVLRVPPAVGSRMPGFGDDETRILSPSHLLRESMKNVTMSRVREREGFFLVRLRHEDNVYYSRRLMSF